MSDTFLTKEEIATLTGRKIKSLQIKQLQKMGLPFFINAVNEPVVARVTIEGKSTPPEPQKARWEPNVLKKSFL